MLSASTILAELQTCLDSIQRIRTNADNAPLHVGMSELRPDEMDLLQCLAADLMYESDRLTSLVRRMLGELD